MTTEPDGGAPPLSETEITAIRHAHHRDRSSPQECDFCAWDWPCETARGVATVDVLLAELDAARRIETEARALAEMMYLAGVLDTHPGLTVVFSRLTAAFMRADDPTIRRNDAR